MTNLGVFLIQMYRWLARTVPFFCEQPSLFPSPAIIKVYIVPQGTFMRTKQRNICKSYRRQEAPCFIQAADLVERAVVYTHFHIIELEFSRCVRNKKPFEKYSSLKHTCLRFTYPEVKRARGGFSDRSQRGGGEKFCLFSSDQCALLM